LGQRTARSRSRRLRRRYRRDESEVDDRRDITGSNGHSHPGAGLVPETQDSGSGVFHGVFKSGVTEDVREVNDFMFRCFSDTRVHGRKNSVNVLSYVKSASPTEREEELRRCRRRPW